MHCPSLPLEFWTFPVEMSLEVYVVQVPMVEVVQVETAQGV